MSKISIIGSGNIGSAIASMLCFKSDHEIVLFDINENFAKGRALDISHCAIACGSDAKILFATSYKDISDSDVVIVTAGLARKGEMTREDLMFSNAEVIKIVAKNVGKYAKNAFVIVVTNPLDSMVALFHKYSEMDSKMVVGMSGSLDSARFSYFLSVAFDVKNSSINPYVFGCHGDDMVPISSLTTINNVTLDEYCNSSKRRKILDDVIAETKCAGKYIIDLVGTSSFFGPAGSIYEMCMSYLNNEARGFCCCSMIPENSYGNNFAIYSGSYAKISKLGCEFVNLKISEQESLDLLKSINFVFSNNKKLGIY